MSNYLRPIVGLVALGLFVGLALGLALGYFVVPVNYINGDVAYLRSPQKDDWVNMTAAAYALDGNLADAMQRVNRLDRDPATAAKYVADAAQRAIDRQDARNARNVAALANAIGAGTAGLRQYLQSTGTPAPTARP
ncbi:MAG: hypothetical protein HZB53_11130 [Chloroflexi bacterium]|nr:hypothetical protein [Chloroflexota bacterium]